MDRQAVFLRFILFLPLNHPVHASGAEGENPVDPADGGGAGPGLLQNLGVHQPLVQQAGHVIPLLHGPQLSHGTQIIKKGATLLHALQLHNALIQRHAALLARYFGHRLLLVDG